MFGYACRETPQYMPAAIHYSHAILRSLADKVDQLIVGGGIANTFLAAAGLPIVPHTTTAKKHSVFEGVPGLALLFELGRIDLCAARDIERLHRLVRDARLLGRRTLQRRDDGERLVLDAELHADALERGAERGARA